MVFFRFALRIVFLTGFSLIFKPLYGHTIPGHESAPLRILVLNSFHPGQPWGDDYIDSLKAALQTDDKQIEFYIEYMDTERHHHLAHMEQLMNIYRDRYLHTKFDCIVSFGDEAFEFLRRYDLQLFGNVPVIFADVSDDKRDRLAGYENFTGLTMQFDAGSTIATIRKLHPEITRLVLITDNSGSGNQIRQAMDNARNQLSTINLEVWQSADFSTPELLKEAGSLGTDAVILFAGCSNDVNRLYFSSRWCLQRIIDYAQVPVYGMSDSYLGNGIIGGDLYSARDLGTRSAARVSRVFAGKHPRSMPVSTIRNGTFKFDARQLSAFELQEDDLPAGSAILFKETSFFERYRVQIWIAAGVFLAQGITILLLILAIVRRGRAETALAHTEQTLDLAVQGADLGLWSLHLIRNTVTMNNRWAEILGYRPQELEIGFDQWMEMIHPEDKTSFITALDAHLAGEISIFRAEHRMIAGDGSIRWIVTRGKVVIRDTLNKKTPIRVAGTHLDITEQRDAEIQRNELKEQLVQRQKIESIGELTVAACPLHFMGICDEFA